MTQNEQRGYQARWQEWGLSQRVTRGDKGRDLEAGQRDGQDVGQEESVPDSDFQWLRWCCLNQQWGVWGTMGSSRRRDVLPVFCQWITHH